LILMPFSDDDVLYRRKISLYRITRGLFSKFRVSHASRSECDMDHLLIDRRLSLS
jgi:hypothetical protein